MKKLFFILMLVCVAAAPCHARQKTRTMMQKQRSVLMARIMARGAHQVQLRTQDEAWLAQSQQEFAAEKKMAGEIQSKIDAKNAQITSLSKKLAHYEFAWSIIAVVVATLVAFLVFRLVGLMLPWGLVAVGASFAATYAAVFFLPNLL